ncbi:MAG: hypothetical protein IKY94_15145 [Lachnospiraceae bacterium]|jgi:hypothetical protein|nr:hypothetical protein [Lachnospiraceae bacterium]
MSYREKDIVFVSVPMGDFSNKKIIVGKKSRAASDLKDVILDEERVNLVGLPIEKIYPSLESMFMEKGIYGSIENFSEQMIPTESKDSEF